jgi:hypothetical protein
MRRLFWLFCFLQAISSSAQNRLYIFNVVQAGQIPATINNGSGHINTSGLSCNVLVMGKKRFLRFDGTWLARYVATGKKDSSIFKDTNRILGKDLPVFTLTYGWNIIRRSNFTIGAGLNLDSRTFYSNPIKKARYVIDAVNTGVVIGLKARLKPLITYSCLAGYDLMFVDANLSNQNSIGSQKYLQNNLTYLLGKRVGINVQFDFSYKQFDRKGLMGGQFYNQNIKLGVAVAIP